jgi:hypothetical protein
VPRDPAIAIWSLHHSLTNLYRRAAALYAFLMGRKPSPLPENLMPSSPLGPAENEAIRKEQATPEELRRWVERDSFWTM